MRAIAMNDNSTLGITEGKVYETLYIYEAQSIVVVTENDNGDSVLMLATDFKEVDR